MGTTLTILVVASTANNLLGRFSKEDRLQKSALGTGLKHTFNLRVRTVPNKTP
jgi:hypothetical protein